MSGDSHALIKDSTTIQQAYLTVCTCYNSYTLQRTSKRPINRETYANLANWLWRKSEDSPSSPPPSQVPPPPSPPKMAESEAAPSPRLKPSFCFNQTALRGKLSTSPIRHLCSHLTQRRLPPDLPPRRRRHHFPEPERLARTRCTRLRSFFDSKTTTSACRPPAHPPGRV